MKVDVRAKLTFRVGTANSGQFGHVDVAFNEVDTEQDLEVQLTEGKNVAAKVFQAVIAELNQQALQVSGLMRPAQPAKKG